MFSLASHICNNEHGCRCKKSLKELKRGQPDELIQERCQAVTLSKNEKTINKYLYSGCSATPLSSLTTELRKSCPYACP